MSKWKPGDRALIQLVLGDGQSYVYRMSTLVKKSPPWSDQWNFKLDGKGYGNRKLSFCVERWIHEPGVLDKLAEI